MILTEKYTHLFFPSVKGSHTSTVSYAHAHHPPTLFTETYSFCLLAIQTVSSLNTNRRGWVSPPQPGMTSQHTSSHSHALKASVRAGLELWMDTTATCPLDIFDEHTHRCCMPSPTICAADGMKTVVAHFTWDIQKIQNPTILLRNFSSNIKIPQNEIKYKIEGIFNIQYNTTLLMPRERSEFP